MPRRPPARETLEHLARPLLLRLLAPFSAALSAAGFSLDALATAPESDRAPLRSLHDLLDDPAVPAPLHPLVDLLSSLARLATSAGRDALIRFDTAGVLPPRLGPIDLAATCYLDYPTLFSQARVPATGASDPLFRNFVLHAAPADRDPCFDPDRTESVRAYLSDWFRARHRSAYCDIHIKRRGRELHFEITHGRPPATRDVITEDLTTRVITQINGQRSHAMYDEDARLLAVHALEGNKEGIRASFSHGYGGDPGFFARTATLVDGAPLHDLAAALAPDPALGVAAVVLREIVIVDVDGSRGDYSCPSGDVRDTRKWGHIEADLASDASRVVHAKIALHLVGERRPLLVSIQPARNQLDYPRSDARAERVLLDWLAARGIWRGRRSAPAGDFAQATA